MSSVFAAHLADQHARLGVFVDLLENERALLNQPPIDSSALAALIDRKRVVGEALERLEQMRCDILRDAGQSIDMAGSQALAERSDCVSLWAAFVARIETARRLNEANGVHIDARLAQTDRTLAYLSRAQASALYAADGQHAASAGQRISRGV